MRYTLKFWSDDMGSFTQPGCRDLEDALWHINKAREHDGLKPLEMDDLEDCKVEMIPTDSKLSAD